MPFSTHQTRSLYTLQSGVVPAKRKCHACSLYDAIFTALIDLSCCCTLPTCRKQSHESSSQLQIILCPRVSTTLTSALIQPSNPAQHALAESSRPSLQPRNQEASSETLNQEASTEPLAESFIPLQLPTADAQSGATVHTTDEDHDSFQAIELSGTQNSLPAGTYDSVSQASGIADANMQHRQHLPEAVSAIVQQHKLQLQIVKVSSHNPVTCHQQDVTTTIHCWHVLACTLDDTPNLSSVHTMVYMPLP